MIFVAVGSTDFDPLVQQMDTLAPSLDEPVVMQIGNGQYVPRNAWYFRYAPSLEPYYDQASLVVAHGGLGITMEVLSRGLPLISVSNPDRYDGHQDDLLETLAADRYLIWCQDLTLLGEALAEAKRTTFKRYDPPQCRIHVVIADFLRTTAATAIG